MGILNKFLSRTEFESYEDFVQNYTVQIPERFNFAFNVVDEIALNSPEKIAMVWCDDNGSERIFTFGDMKYYSDKQSIGLNR